MKVVLFIPIKLNNQRLPGKNTMPLNGKPLCKYMFETVNALNNIDEKYVYCSDEKIIPYIPDGLQFLKRPEYLDDFKVKGLDIIGQFVKDVDADIYIITHVTQPFVEKESFDKALDAVINKGYDSAFSVIELQDYFWVNGKPLNYDPSNIVRTQDLDPVYKETGAFFIFTKEVFEKHHRRIGFKPYMQVLKEFESIDIDTKEDFDMAEAIAEYLEKRKCE
ncbi:acylneuraminate cytidylyltransferase family protein [Methanomethylophilus alvi]|uniref:acylneuraminate cytidylyltransferase family protein n=1 Tax=Methanomethylophilus alvi TaxID=1291540 RepID=UPI0037DDDC01